MRRLGHPPYLYGLERLRFPATVSEIETIKRRQIMRKLLFVLLCIFPLSALAVEPPEPIAAVFRAKAGKEAELLAALQDDHATMERLGLITGPYTLYRGRPESGPP